MGHLWKKAWELIVRLTMMMAVAEAARETVTDDSDYRPTGFK